MKLNASVINKYNKLFNEVVAYYGLQSEVMIYSSNRARKLHHIQTGANSKFESLSLAKEIKFLKNKGYILLIPFHIFSCLIIRDSFEQINNRHFTEMNAAIEVLRKKRDKTTNNKKV